MKRLGTLLMAMAVVAALLAIPLGVSAATSDHDEPATAGEQLSGVLGVQGAALDGDLSDRTFGQKIANADSDEARADLVADRLTEIEHRISDHETKLADLEAQRDAGEITEGRYRAQVATVEAERANTERQADRAGDTARGLPEGVLAERGVSVDRIDELRTNARQLGGPATSEAAREIAGENVTRPIAGDREDRGDRPGVDRATPDRESGSNTDRMAGDQERRNQASSDQRSESSDTDDSRSTNTDDTRPTDTDDSRSTGSGDSKSISSDDSGDDGSSSDSSQSNTDRENNGANADRSGGPGQSN